MFTEIALITAVVTAAACAPLVAFLRHKGHHDVPNERSSHAVPTPRGGGIAVIVGAVVASSMVAMGAAPPWTSATWAALCAAGALAALGFADDVRDLPPITRLLLQVAVGVLAGAALGGLTGAIIGAVVIPTAVNMVNFMDGINGLCAGHAAVWGVGALLASRTGGGDVLLVLGAISLGGGLGFLPWNAPHARLFLGDVGSYLFGALVGVGLLSAVSALGADSPSPSAGAFITTLALVGAPYLLFALDTSAALARRLAAGEPVLRAHRSHVYQRLVNEGGLPHWVVSLAMALASLLATLAVSWSLAAGLAVSGTVGIAYFASPWLRRVAVAA